jgi:hypothetical protein
VSLERWAASVLGGRPQRIGTPSDAEVYAGAGLVLKVHAPGTVPADLSRRLAAAESLAPLLSPVEAEPRTAPDGRPATLWPRVPVLTADAPVPPDVWRHLGVLLAGLHREPPPDLPPARPLRRLARAVARLDGTSDDQRVVSAEAGRLLAAGLVGEGRAVVHGDLHLGQVGVVEAGLVLLDVDELAVGDPAWDLARPAGFWATGLLPDEEWSAFLEGYRSAAGSAVPAETDPWGRLELPARCAVVAAAANALSGHLPCTPEERKALTDACRAMERSVP